MASWRHVFFLLGFLGLLSACVILGMLFWMTSQIERTEEEKAYALVDLKLSETAKALSLAVEDYAYWTLAHDVVAARDDAGVLENLGSGATESALFDQIFIVGPDGTLLYAFDEVMGDEAQTLFDPAAVSPVWAALTQNDPADYLSVSSVIDRNGQVFQVVGAWITPDAIADMPDAELTAMYGLIQLDQQRLDALLGATDITRIELTPFDPVASDAAGLTLTDLNDVPVATVTWDIQSLGTRLRDKLLPSVILIAASVLGICALAARYFRLQYIALGQARKIATTDQLTGVLNRAGLAESLRSKDILRSLERGHLAAIYLDLNKFKALNDTFGHEVGDIALRVTAERIQTAVRKTDIVARLGGDEFICVVVDPEAESAAIRVAERILALAKSPVSFNESEQIVTPSVGLAVASPGTAWETVLSHADAAMYWSKQKQADYPVLFCKSMDSGNESFAIAAA
ncbi:diguanylate cyclase [uncultured Tateyamaria sp.]|uniref:GGDEF domain-containing protein n=1 Tax=Tateyamaria sp. 1078 TaxID=3417464 RepID=UPI0026030470|nr:diguanylate cyclase [uncultured Tateyamaria sp.]